MKKANINTKDVIEQYSKYVIANYSRLPIVVVRGELHTRCLGRTEDSAWLSFLLEQPISGVTLYGEILSLASIPILRGSLVSFRGW